MTVWLVAQHNGGDPEPDGVFSIWTEIQDAGRELERLDTLHKPSDGYRFYVIGVELDTPKDSPVV